MHSRHFLPLQSWLALIPIYDHAAAATTSPAKSSSPTSSVDPNLLGTYIGLKTTSRVDCPDGAGPYVHSSTYGGCCVNDDCRIATKCQAGTAYYKDATKDCGTGVYQCETMTIYDSYPSPSQSWIWQDCLANLIENTVYRSIQTTSSTASSPTSSISTTARSSPTSGSAPTSSLTPTTSPTTNPTPVNHQRSSSKTWIAGAVIGPIILVAAAGALAFWLKRRGKPIPTSDPRPLSGQIGYVRSMPPALSNSN